MSDSFHVPQKSGDQHKEKLKRKHCSFPGCTKFYLGTGKSKFCKEHREQKYRKVIDEGKVIRKKVKQSVNNSNQIFHHEFTEPVNLIMQCALEGCDEEFLVNVYPKTYMIPKYCLKHRNSFKREMFSFKNKE